MLKITQRRKIWYFISALVVVPGIISLFIWSLRVGIDFAGGSLLEVKIKQDQPVSAQIIEEGLADKHLDNLSIQNSGENQFLLRYRQSAREKIDDGLLADELVKQLNDKVGESEKVLFENVGPTVSGSLTRKAIYSVIIATLLIILYIAYAFRGVPSQVASWKMGVMAIVALIHDLLFVVGAFSILGHWFPIFEVNALFISALLTILGFSVHDTIVVYDRIRENLRKMPGKKLEEVTNASVNQTIGRSLNTSLTVIIVLLSLVILGGSSIRSFLLALLLGIFIGTYSSIFIASPLLVTFEKRKK